MASIDFSGKTIKVEDIEAPYPIAPAFLFGKNNKFPVNITANNDVELLLLPKDTVINILQTNVIFLNNFLNSISSRAQFLENKIKFLSFKTIFFRGKYHPMNLLRDVEANYYQNFLDF